MHKSKVPLLAPKEMKRRMKRNTINLGKRKERGKVTPPASCKFIPTLRRRKSIREVKASMPPTEHRNKNNNKNLIHPLSSSRILMKLHLTWMTQICIASYFQLLPLTQEFLCPLLSTSSRTCLPQYPLLLSYQIVKRQIHSALQWPAIPAYPHRFPSATLT